MHLAFAGHAYPRGGESFGDEAALTLPTMHDNAPVVAPLTDVVSADVAPAIVVVVVVVVVVVPPLGATTVVELPVVVHSPNLTHVPPEHFANRSVVP